MNQLKTICNIAWQPKEVFSSSITLAEKNPDRNEKACKLEMKFLFVNVHHVMKLVGGAKIQIKF